MFSSLEAKGIVLLSQIENLLEIPEIHKDIDSQIWIVDEKLVKTLEPLTIKKLYAVSSGEKLKDIDAFAAHTKRILQLAESISTKKLSIVSFGGGSVGDFAGFMASILRRGVRLFHIPSTWLACIDSAHGGKTALNVDLYKNQIGTFYSAEKVFLIKEILESQPEHLKVDAFAELFKIALLKGEGWFDNFVYDIPQITKNSNLLWKYIMKAIAAKYDYIQKDPKEKLGLRTELNLGHTLAHVLENQLGLRHGEAVGKGLHFALEWSAKKNYLSQPERYQTALEKLGHSRQTYVLKEQDLQAGLARDKKISDRDVLKFIFLEKVGKAKIEDVSFRELSQFAKDAGWLE